MISDQHSVQRAFFYESLDPISSTSRGHHLCSLFLLCHIIPRGRRCWPPSPPAAAVASIVPFSSSAALLFLSSLFSEYTPTSSRSTSATHAVCCCCCCVYLILPPPPHGPGTFGLSGTREHRICRSSSFAKTSPKDGLTIPCPPLVAAAELPRLVTCTRGEKMERKVGSAWAVCCCCSLKAFGPNGERSAPPTPPRSEAANCEVVVVECRFAELRRIINGLATLSP